MDPVLAAAVIASVTDSIIWLSAEKDGVSYEQRQLEVMKALEKLQPKADDLENWLRNK